MLKKRLVGVVIVKNGWAVQSFGYSRYLPLGRPEYLVENLDRWGADEILVLSIDRSIYDKGPDLILLERLAQLGIGTPLIYGGGIRSINDGMQVIQMGADRICVDALMHDGVEVIKGLSQQLGVQAVIGAMPISWSNKKIEWFNYQTKISSTLTNIYLSGISKVISELLVIDWRHEGQVSGFDSRLVTCFPDKNIPLIAFGGISELDQMNNLLPTPNVSAVAIANLLSYKEHAIQQIKEGIVGASLRLSNYESRNTLISDV